MTQFIDLSAIDAKNQGSSSSRNAFKAYLRQAFRETEQQENLTKAADLLFDAIEQAEKDATSAYLGMRTIQIATDKIVNTCFQNAAEIEKLRDRGVAPAGRFEYQIALLAERLNATQKAMRKIQTRLEASEREARSLRELLQIKLPMRRK